MPVIREFLGYVPEAEPAARTSVYPSNSPMYPGPLAYSYSTDRGPARGPLPLLVAIPGERRVKAAAEVAEILRSLRAVDAACGVGATAADVEVAAERLERGRHS